MSEFSHTWSILKNAIEKIQANETGSLSYGELYRLGYNLVISKNEALLYQSVKECFENQLKTSISPLINLREDVCQHLLALWSSYLFTVSHCSDIFMYLDKQYCLPSADILPVHHMGMQQFRLLVLEENEPILWLSTNELMSKMFPMPSMDNSVQQTCLQFIKMLFLCDPKYEHKIFRHQQTSKNISKEEMYQKFFALPFMAHLVDYFTKFCQQLEKNSLSEFLHKIQIEIESLKSFCETMNNNPNSSTFVDNALDVLMRLALKNILSDPVKGLSCMIREKNVDDLSVLGKLFINNWELFECLQTALGQTLLHLLKSASFSTSTIKDISCLKTEWKEIVQSCFSNKASYVDAISNAFFFAFNDDVLVTAKLLASNLDALLVTSETDDNEIKNLVELARFLADKEPFLEFHRVHLYNRLISCGLGCVHKERKTLSLLEELPGQSISLISSINQIISDVEFSKTLCAEFFKSQSNASRFKFVPHVIRRCVWMKEKQQTFTLPPTLVISQTAFTQFYASKFHKRNLTWLFNKGSSELYWFGREYTLIVRTHQMLLLLLYNHSSSWLYCDILSALQGEKEDIDLALISLCGNPKFRILNRVRHHSQEQSVQFEPTDCFVFNDDFQLTTTSNVVRIPYAVATNPSDSSSNNQVATGLPSLPNIQDLRLRVDACICKQIKHSPTLQKKELVANSLTILNSSANKNSLITTDFVEERIESLEKREIIVENM